MSKELTPDHPVFLIDEENTKFDLLYESDAKTDRDGRVYEFVGMFLENDDFYQGLCMITVIRRISDGKEFGYGWWDDISKHGESYMESNGGDFGLGIDWEHYDENEPEPDEYCVFEPVEPWSLPGYRRI